MDDLAIGIDIGASKIFVAVCRGDKAEVILNSEGEKSTQFCLAFNNKERFFGVAAENQFPTNPENTIHGSDVINVIGLHKEDFVQEMMINGNAVQIDEANDCLKFSIQYNDYQLDILPEQALFMMLKKIKKDIEATQQIKLTKAVITVPSMFNSSQRFAIKNAVLAAGIDVQSIINDSTATAITYSVDYHNGNDKNIFVFDMGATSIDVAVVHLSGNLVEVKGCGGSLNLGGESFVLRLVQHFIEEFESKKGVCISDDKKIVAKLRMACEKFKKMLSATSEANYIIESFYEGEQYQIKMTRKIFESICEDLFEQVSKLIEEVVIASKLPKKTINEVIVVGNGGRILKIEEIVSQLFDGKELSKYDESVAIGAAYFGTRNLPGASYRVRNLELKEMLATSLNVQLGDNGILTMVMKDEFVPHNTGVIYSYNNDHALDIIVKQNISVVDKIMVDHSPVSIKTNIDANGLVNLIVSVAEGKLMTSIDHQTYDEAKIEQIKAQEEAFEEHEMEYKKVTELSSDLLKLCLLYKRAMMSKKMKDVLNDADKMNVLYRCYEVFDWLDQCKHPEIDKLIKKREEVKEIFENVSEKAEFARKLNQVNSLLDQKDYNKADASYVHLMETYGQHISDEQRNDLMLKRSSALMELKDYREVVNVLDDLICSQNPENVNYLAAIRTRGICHFELNNYTKCMNDLEIVLKCEECPELRAMRNKAEAERFYEIVKQVLEEPATLTKRKMFAKSNELLLDFLGSTNEFIGFSAETVQDLRSKVYIMLGNNNFMMNDYKKAIKDCEFAEKYSDKNNEDIWKIRTESYLELGMLQEAASGIQSLETIKSFNKDRLHDLKSKLQVKLFDEVAPKYETLIKNKQYQAALSILRPLIIDKLPKNLQLEFYVKYAQAEYFLKKYDSCIKICQAALDIDNKFLPALNLRALCYYYACEEL